MTQEEHEQPEYAQPALGFTVYLSDEGYVCISQDHAEDGEQAVILTADEAKSVARRLRAAIKDLRTP